MPADRSPEPADERMAKAAGKWKADPEHPAYCANCDEHEDRHVVGERCPPTEAELERRALVGEAQDAALKISTSGFVASPRAMFDAGFDAAMAAADEWIKALNEEHEDLLDKAEEIAWEKNEAQVRALTEALRDLVRLKDEKAVREGTGMTAGANHTYRAEKEAAWKRAKDLLPGGRTFDRLVRVLLAESDGRTDAETSER